MSCEATMNRLLELPAWRFSEVRHLAECEACRSIAAAIAHGQDALADDVEAFASGGDFDAVFGAAVRPEPAVAPPRFNGVHGFVIALAATAALLVAGADAPIWQTLWPGSDGSPALSDEEQEALEIADEVGQLEDGDLTEAEWAEEAYLLANDAMRFASDDVAAFEIWIAALRAAQLGNVPQIPDLALDRATFLATLDPGLVWLVDDPEVRDLLRVPGVAIAVLAERHTVVIDGERVHGENRLVELDHVPVPVVIDGTSCGDFEPGARLVVRAEDGTVAVDDRAPVRCVKRQTESTRAVVPTAPVVVPLAVDPPVVAEAVQVDPVQDAVRAEPKHIEQPERPEPGDASDESPCHDLTTMEARARLGQLAMDEVRCLTAQLAMAERQTMTDRISRLLLANADRAWNKDRWAQLAADHLENFGFDADLAYLYAKYLAEHGRYVEAIKWADSALDNRKHWTGDEHVQRVHQSFRVKAYAFQQLWFQAEDQQLKHPTDEGVTAVWTLRMQVKTAAREWYDFAESAGLDSKPALALCASAAATIDACR